MPRHNGRTLTLTLMTLGALVLIVSLSLVLQDATTVTAREMLHPCPEAGEGHTQEEHDNTCGTHTPTPTATPTATPTDPPANFSVSSVGINSVTLQWGALRSHRGITSARISVYQQPEGSAIGQYKYIGRHSANRSGGSLRVSNLKSDTLYQFYLLYSTRSGLGMGGMLLVRTQRDPTQPTPTPTPTPLPKPVDAPLNFRVTDIRTNVITLRWGPAPRNRGLSSAEVLRYDHNGSEFRFPADGRYGVGISFEGESSLHMNLKPDTLYRFILRYLDVDGDTVMSRSVTARTLAVQTPTPTSTPLPSQATPTPTPTPTPTTAPVNFRVSGVGRDSISLQWGAAPRNRGIISGEIKVYEYMEYQSRYQYIRGHNAGLSAGTLLLSPLKSDTLYKFILTYRNRDYDVVMRPAVTARTQSRFTPTVTSTPTNTPTPLPTLINDPTANFRATGAGRDSIALKWEAAPRNRGIVSAYISAYERTDSQDSFVGSAGREYRYLGNYDVTTSAGELLISGLKSGRVHKFYLLYRTRTGGPIMGGLVLVRTQSTHTPTPTPRPVVPSLTAPALTAQAGENAVELSWTSVPGAVRYELMVWGDPLLGWQRLVADNRTSYTHSGLTAGRKYYYTIRTVNAAGAASAWLQPYASVTLPVAPGSPLPTPTATATSTPPPSDDEVGRVDDPPEPTPTPTPTPTPRPVVSSLAAPPLTAQAGEYAVELSWNSVPGAERYELLVWEDPLIGWQRLVEDNRTSYTHSGLTAGRKYHYTIRAVNAAGAASAWLQPYASAVPSAPTAQ